MRDTAAALGRKDDVKHFDSEYRRIRNAYNSVFFDPSKDRYEPANQANQAVPLAFGIVPEGKEPKVADALATLVSHPEINVGKMGVSIRPTPFFRLVLCCGEVEA